MALFLPATTSFDPQHLMNCIESNNGFVSEKISFRKSDPSKSDVAIQAVKRIAFGETLMLIPSPCLFKSNTGDSQYFVNRLEHDRDQRGKDRSKVWRYVEYVLEYFTHHDHLPDERSKTAKMLWENLPDKHTHLSDKFGSFQPCDEFYKPNDDRHNKILDAASRMADSRRWWNETLIPVFNMESHCSERWNNLNGVEIYALRDIQAGEQLYLSSHKSQIPYPYSSEGEVHSAGTFDLISVHDFVTAENDQKIRVAKLPKDKEWTKKVHVNCLRHEYQRQIEAIKDYMMRQTLYWEAQEKEAILSCLQSRASTLRQVIAYEEATDATTYHDHKAEPGILVDWGFRKLHTAGTNDYRSLEAKLALASSLYAFCLFTALFALIKHGFMKRKSRTY